MNTQEQTASKVVLSVKDLNIQLKGSTDATGQPKLLVKGLNLQVRAGETLCIVGESGSGKSLTSLAIMGLLPADSLQVSSGAIDLD